MHPPVRWRTSSYSTNNGACVEVGSWRTSSYSTKNGNCVEVGSWRTSRYSTNNGDCVEVGAAPAAVLVRDTKDRSGGLVAVAAPGWRALLDTLR